MIYIVGVVLAVAALSVAACAAKRASSKAILLGTMLLLITMIWAYFVLALGVLAGHELTETVARWPSPWLLAFIGLIYFAAVASFAFLRKID